MAADRVSSHTVSEKGQAAAASALDHQLSGLGVWGYWSTVTSTIGLLVYLGWLA